MATALSVYVPEGTFGVLDAGEIPVQTADWSNGLAVPMSQGALVVTGIHAGAIRATVTALPRPPATSTDASWEEIAEVSVHVPTGLLRVESLEDGPVDGLAPSARRDRAGIGSAFTRAAAASSRTRSAPSPWRTTSW